MVVLDTESVNLDDGERPVWQFSVFFARRTAKVVELDRKVHDRKRTLCLLQSAFYSFCRVQMHSKYGQCFCSKCLNICVFTIRCSFLDHHVHITFVEFLSFELFSVH